MKIESSSYQSITIDGKEYNKDIYILPGGAIEARPHTHDVNEEQIARVLEEDPDVVIVGCGTQGNAAVTPAAKKILDDSDVELIAKKTPDIHDDFNRLSKEKRVAAIIHTTC